MKTEVKPVTTEGKTDAPGIFHAYITHLTVGDKRYECTGPLLSLCKQNIKYAKDLKPLTGDEIKCVVCLDLAYESSL